MAVHVLAIHVTNTIAILMLSLTINLYEFLIAYQCLPLNLMRMVGEKNGHLLTARTEAYLLAIVCTCTYLLSLIMQLFGLQIKFSWLKSAFLFCFTLLLQVPTTTEVDGSDQPASSQDSSQPEDKVPETTTTESVIPALDLSSKVEPEDDSLTNSDSQNSSPTSSLPPGLKSALRSPRRRACKSVSFSEEVLVELFLEGPNRLQKGGNKKKKGRRSPFFGPRRRIEKLKDNSWESYSDSELLRHNGASTEEEDQDQDQDQDHEGADEWNWKPDQVLMRQSSSESESGPEVPSSPRNKGKKSKGSRRRRKEKARREACLAVNNGSENLDSNKTSTNPESTEDTSVDSHGNHVEHSTEDGVNGEGDNSNVSSAQKPSSDIIDEKNNNLEKNDNNEELPLELQDHKTKCAFEFSNQVIYDLDE